MGVNGVYGLSGTGIDVDSMVEKMMNAKKQPYNKLYQEKTRSEWRKDEYLSLYSSINSYRDEIFNYKLSGTLSPMKVTVSGSDTDKAAVSISANSDASIFSHKVEVKEVAQAANMTSKSQIEFKTKDADGNVIDDKEMKLTSLLGDDLPEGVKKYQAQQTIVKTAQEALVEAQKKYETDKSDANKTAVETATATLNNANDALAELGKVEVMNLGISDGKNSKDLKYTAADLADGNIYDFISDVDNLGLDIKANFDKNVGRVFLYAKNSGESNQISIEAKAVGSSTDSGQKLLQGLKLTDSTSATKVSTGNAADGFIAGSDAKITIDGMEVTSEKNTITVAGVTYTVNAKTTNPVTAQINSDVDKTVETIKKFVESYNKILDTLNKKNTETYYKDYAPLTDDQKAEMTDDQIKQWETKSKSGLLRKDEILKSLITGMRSAVTNVVTGTNSQYNSAASIGITTKTYSEGGKLYLDEDVLRKALDQDPDAVSKVFASDGDTTSEKGIANRLYDSLKTTMDKIADKAGTPALGSNDTSSYLAKKIDKYSDRMTAMLKRLNAYQTQYYKKFDALETAYSKLSSQTAWLTNSLS